MNPHRSPSQTLRKGGVSPHKTCCNSFFEWVGSIRILPRSGFRFFYFFLFFLTQHTSNSQTSKEPTPIFVLQGTAVLKGKPTEGVYLELTKDDKQITKIVTQRNGMYSFQLNKSNTIIENEYILNIVKQNTVTGVLRINTYTPKEEFDYLPYIFNLDINLVIPSVSDGEEKHDYGKIKWDSKKRIFDFDKNYVKTIIKDKNIIKTDSIRELTEVTDKIKNQQEAVKKKNYEDSLQKANSLTIQKSADQRNTQLTADSVGKKEEENGSLTKTVKVISPPKDLEKDAVQPNVKLGTLKLTESKAFETDLLSKKKEEDTVLKANEYAVRQVDLKERNDSGKVLSAISKVVEKAALKTSEINRISNIKTDNRNETSLLKKKTDAAAKQKNHEQENNPNDIKEKKTSEKVSAEMNMKTSPSFERTLVQAGKPISVEKNSSQSLDQFGNPVAYNVLTLQHKEDFSLTGIPMGLFNTKGSADDISQNSFDAKNIFAINSERSKLFNAKEKFERTKAANLTKKYETSNIMTSLLDVVAEYDKK